MYNTVTQVANSHTEWPKAGILTQLAKLWLLTNSDPSGCFSHTVTQVGILTHLVRKSHRLNGDFSLRVGQGGTSHTQGPSWNFSHSYPSEVVSHIVGNVGTFHTQWPKWGIFTRSDPNGNFSHTVAQLGKWGLLTHNDPSGDFSQTVTQVGTSHAQCPKWGLLTHSGPTGDFLHTVPQVGTSHTVMQVGTSHTQICKWGHWWLGILKNEHWILNPPPPFHTPSTPFTSLFTWNPRLPE